MEDYQNFRKVVMSHALGRKQEKTLKDETDFFAGAMAAMDALGEVIPPAWFIMIMSGRSIIDEYEKELEREQQENKND